MPPTRHSLPTPCRYAPRSGAGRGQGALGTAGEGRGPRPTRHPWEIRMNHIAPMHEPAIRDIPLCRLALAPENVRMLAPAPVEPLRQHGPGRAQLVKLGLQRLDPAPRSPDGLAQPGVLHGQRPDRGLLAPRSAQDPAQLGIHVGQLLRQRIAGGAKPRKPGFRRLPARLRRLHGPAQPGVLLAQPGDRGLLAPRPPKQIAQVSGLVERQSRQRRPERAELGKPSRQLLPRMLGTSRDLDVLLGGRSRGMVGPPPGIVPPIGTVHTSNGNGDCGSRCKVARAPS